MQEIKSYFEFYFFLIDRLVLTKSNNVIWYINYQTLDDLWYDDEEPWVDVSLLVDNQYYYERVHESELTEESIKKWDNIIKSALKSKSTEYNEDAKIIHNAIKTIIESGEDLDQNLIKLRNELQRK